VATQVVTIAPCCCGVLRVAHALRAMSAHAEFTSFPSAAISPAAPPKDEAHVWWGLLEKCCFGCHSGTDWVGGVAFGAMSAEDVPGDMEVGNPPSASCGPGSCRSRRKRARCSPGSSAGCAPIAVGTSSEGAAEVSVAKARVLARHGHVRTCTVRCMNRVLYATLLRKCIMSRKNGLRFSNRRSRFRILTAYFEKRLYGFRKMSADF
jgi:hypothetical protein